MKYEKQLKMILDYFNSITKDMIEVIEVSKFSTYLRGLPIRSDFSFAICFDNTNQCFVFDKYGRIFLKKEAELTKTHLEGKGYDTCSDDWLDNYVITGLVLNWSKIKDFYEGLISQHKERQKILKDFIG